MSGQIMPQTSQQAAARGQLLISWNLNRNPHRLGRIPSMHLRVACHQRCENLLTRPFHVASGKTFMPTSTNSGLRSTHTSSRAGSPLACPYGLRHAKASDPCLRRGR